jgi:hypothetical protein
MFFICMKAAPLPGQAELKRPGFPDSANQAWARRDAAGITPWY